MWKVFKLLLGRLRLSRPRRVFTVRSDEVRTVQEAARLYFAGALVMAVLYGYERMAHHETQMRARPVIGVVLGPTGRPVETFDPEDMTDRRWAEVASMFAAQHVVRTRQVTEPIDVALAGLAEGVYFVDGPAALKYAELVKSQPYHEMTMRRQHRPVNLDEVAPSLAPGQDPSSRRLRILVQWPEAVYSGGRLEKRTQRMGWVDVERLGEVQAEYQKRNPMGIFVMDYDVDIPSGSTASVAVPGGG